MAPMPTPTPGILNGDAPSPEALEAARRAVQSLASPPGDLALTDRLNELLDGGSTAPLGRIALALAAVAFAVALRHYRRRAPR